MKTTLEIAVSIVSLVYGGYIVHSIWRKKLERLEDRISILEAAALANQESGEWNELN